MGNEVSVPPPPPKPILPTHTTTTSSTNVAKQYTLDMFLQLTAHNQNYWNMVKGKCANEMDQFANYAGTQENSDEVSIIAQ
jgi:hypothetical protein